MAKDIMDVINKQLKDIESLDENDLRYVLHFMAGYSPAGFEQALNRLKREKARKND